MSSRVNIGGAQGSEMGWRYKRDAVQVHFERAHGGQTRILNFQSIASQLTPNVGKGKDRNSKVNAQHLQGFGHERQKDTGIDGQNMLGRLYAIADSRSRQCCAAGSHYYQVCARYTFVSSVRASRVRARQTMLRVRLHALETRMQRHHVRGCWWW